MIDFFAADSQIQLISVSAATFLNYVPMKSTLQPTCESAAKFLRSK